MKGFVRTLLLAAVLSIGGPVSAARLQPRQDTTASSTSSSAPSSSVSVSSSDSPTSSAPTSTSSATASITSVPTSSDSGSTSVLGLTTINGTATTVDNPTATATCSNKGAFAPFCWPTVDLPFYIGDTYNILWDPTYFQGVENDTLIVQVLYKTVAANAGNVAYTVSNIASSSGLNPITVDKNWLQGSSTNNVTISLKSVKNPSLPESISATLTVEKKPAPTPTGPPPKTKPLAVVIAVPVAIVFIILMTCGVCLAFRKHRQIGLGNVMGRRNGYGVGKSRKERTRGKGAIKMEPMTSPIEDARVSNEWEIESTRGRGANGTYHDEPTHDNNGRNAFRDEMDRQHGV